MSTTYAALVANHIYAYNDELLEAYWLAEASTWRLYVIGEDGEYIEPRQGALFAYELRTDGTGVWDPLYLAQVARIWPSWQFLRGAPVTIDPATLEYLADSRNDLQAAGREQEETFQELMAEFDWR